MNLLLHTCCAPCLAYPSLALKAKGIKVTSLFYNPNIHPVSEYMLRRESVERYSKKTGLDVIYEKYDIEDFFKAIGNFRDSGERCNKCWRLRLEKTARYAKENGFGAFTTTLFISPYQDYDAIKDLCVELSGENDIEFYHEDFRPFFSESKRKAREMGLYMQNYCGCIFSDFAKYKGKL